MSNSKQIRKMSEINLSIYYDVESSTLYLEDSQYDCEWKFEDIGPSEMFRLKCALERGVHDLVADIFNPIVMNNQLAAVDDYNHVKTLIHGTSISYTEFLQSK